MAVGAEFRARLIEYWMAAKRSKIGVRIIVENYDTVRAALHTVRQELLDPELAEFSITPSRENPATELWIIRKNITVTIPDEEVDDASRET